MLFARFRKLLPTMLFLAICAPAHAEDLPFFLPYPKIDTNRWYIAHGWANGWVQSCEWRKENLKGEDKNLRITLSDNGGKVHPIGCGEMQSKQRYHYGMYSARIRAAKGSGLNTAFFTYIGPAQGVKAHDEIDFEFLGKDTTMVQLNYYVGGKPQDPQLIKLGFDASEDFHDYHFVWEPTRITWFVDKKKVYETKPGAKLPTLPSKIFVTLWSGSEKVNDWLGPFEYKQDATADFAWVKFTRLP
ncbi:MAG: family 16 glycosylhydrolase [Rickettsiales bacterium]|nr:family 16 glycosylhydrolase [Rickettsiales bacterium]